MDLTGSMIIIIDHCGFVVLAEVCNHTARVSYRRRQKSVGKWETWPLATPKRLNRSSPNVAYVITSWISIHMQNLSHDPSVCFFSPYARNCASKMFTRLLFSQVLPVPTAHSPGPWTDFHAKYVKRRGSVQGCAFSVLENKDLIFNLPYSQKPPFLGPLLVVLRKFLA